MRFLSCPERRDQQPCQGRRRAGPAGHDGARAALLGRPRIRSCGTLTAGNSGRCLAPTERAVLICAALAVAAVLTPLVDSEPTAGPADNRGAAAEAATDGEAGTRPDLGDVVGAYLELRRWVRRFDPPALDDPAAKLPLRDGAGACVMLRHRGRVIGSGEDANADELMVRRAVGRALSQVLGHAAVARLPVDLRRRVGSTLTVELEIAGEMIPLPGRSAAQVAEQLQPGLDGVAMRRGETLRAIFPARMLATNTADNIQRSLLSLAGELGLPARPLGELRRRFGIQVYRFRTIHLVERAPDRSPFQTVRGQQLVLRREVTPKSIKAFADALTDHLITSLWTGDEPLGAMGDYHPVRDEYEPLIAPPRDQALIALALARYASCPHLSASEAERVRAAAIAVLDDLAQRAEDEPDPRRDPAACAALVYARSALPSIENDTPIESLFESAARRVIELTSVPAPEHDRADGASAGDPPSAIPPHGRAMLAAAAARLLKMGIGQVDALRVREAIDGVWGSVPEHEWVTLLPWAGWAETDWAEATGRTPANASRLLALRRLLEMTRIGAPGSSAVTGPEDLWGGFALTSGRRGRADAQSTRPAAYLATMLGDSTLTPPRQAPAAVEGQMQTMRFLMQLSVGDSMLWAFPAPQRVKGGLRAATWNSDQPAAAQALGLLAAAETLISLDALSPELSPPETTGAGG